MTMQHQIDALNKRADHVEVQLDAINATLRDLCSQISRLSSKVVLPGEGVICIDRIARIDRLEASINELKRNWSYATGIVAMLLVLLTLFGPVIRGRLGLENVEKKQVGIVQGKP